MTPREYLFASLRGEIPDRPPFWLLFPYDQIGCYVDVRTHPMYKRVHQASRNRAIILNRRAIGIDLFTADVQQRTEQHDDCTRRYISYAGTELFTEYRNGRLTRKMLNTEADIERLLQFPILTDKTEIVRQLDAKRRPYEAEKQAFPEHFGAMMLCQGEPIGFIYGNSDLNEYPVWSLTIPDKIEQFLDASMKRFRHIYSYFLERDMADVYFLVGSELASPPMVNRATFQRWIVPYSTELIAMIHDAGKFAIQHYHGQIKDILPDFLTMRPDALHTIEAPPIGNCTMTEAYDIVGNEITLIGNIQYDDFRALEPTQMKQAVYHLMEECRGKRFILSPTAGPFAPNPPHRLIENYLAFMDAAEEASTCDSRA